MRVTTVFNKPLALQGAFVRRVEFGPIGIVVDVVKRQHRHRCIPTGQLGPPFHRYQRAHGHGLA